MKVAIPNAGVDVTVNVPDRNLATVIYPRELPVIEDTVAAVRKAVQNPIGTRPLSETVNPKTKVTFLCDNWNRPIKHYDLALPVIEELKKGGVKDDNIRFVIGNGVHRQAFSEDIERLFGQWIPKEYGVDNNIRTSKAKLVGITPTYAVPVWVHEWSAEADLNIGLGTLGFNVFAGYGGGAKIICPGCASFETINYNHRLSISPLSVAGEMHRNSMRLDAEEMATMINFNFIVNALFNKEGKTLAVVAGDPVAAQREGAKYASEYYRHILPEPVDILIGGANPRHTKLGAPITDMLWATMMTKNAVKKGGTMIFTHHSPWPEHPICHTRCTWFKECEDMFLAIKPPSEKILLQMHQGKWPGWYAGGLYRVAQQMEVKDIFIVNEVFKPHHLAGSGFQLADTVEDALDIALRKSGPDAKVAVVPYGGRMTYLQVENGGAS